MDIIGNNCNVWFSESDVESVTSDWYSDFSEGFVTPIETSELKRNWLHCKFLIYWKEHAQKIDLFGNWTTNTLVALYVSDSLKTGQWLNCRLPMTI